MIIHGNPAFIEQFGAGVVGQPAREAMIGLPAEGVRADGSRVRDRQARRLPGHDGGRRERLVVAPRRDPETGEIYGVTTHLRPVAD